MLSVVLGLADVGGIRQNIASFMSASAKTEGFGTFQRDFGVPKQLVLRCFEHPLDYGFWRQNQLIKVTSRVLL